MSINFAVISVNSDHEHQPSSFLVIQTSIDRPLQTSPGTVIVNPLPTSPSVTGIASQTGRGASVVSLQYYALNVVLSTTWILH